MVSNIYTQVLRGNTKSNWDKEKRGPQKAELCGESTPPTLPISIQCGATGTSGGSESGRRSRLGPRGAGRAVRRVQGSGTQVRTLGAGGIYSRRAYPNAAGSPQKAEPFVGRQKEDALSGVGTASDGGIYGGAQAGRGIGRRRRPQTAAQRSGCRLERRSKGAGEECPEWAFRAEADFASTIWRCSSWTRSERPPYGRKNDSKEDGQPWLSVLFASRAVPKPGPGERRDAPLPG